MNPLRRHGVLVAMLAAFVPADGRASDAAADSEPAISGTVTGYYYAMRDQPDFGVGVASINRGALHVEARYNYEASDAGSAFLGWKFSGGDAVTFEVTPIIGVLFGAARGAIPGFEASVAYRSVDAYIEAEYVYDSENHSDSYFYAWSEIAWKPVEWLRLGLAGQRTHEVQSSRDLQLGLFAQLMFPKATLGVYVFNPDIGSRYAIVAFGVQF